MIFYKDTKNPNQKIKKKKMGRGGWGVGGWSM